VRISPPAQYEIPTQHSAVGDSKDAVIFSYSLIVVVIIIHHTNLFVRIFWLYTHKCTMHISENELTSQSDAVSVQKAFPFPD